MTLTRFAAVIFDMDGVLVDGEPLHFEAVNELLAEEGLSISLDAYKPYMGTKTGWRDMAVHLGLKRPLEEFAAAYQEVMLEKYRSRSEALPGARELVTALAAANVPLAVASSSIRPWVEACLERIGLREAFSVVVTGSEVAEGKPSPEIYLKAAELLGCTPAACLVFEDAPAGILAAKAAGMTVWAVRTEYTSGLELPGPHRDYASLLEVHPGQLLEVAA